MNQYVIANVWREAGVTGFQKKKRMQ